MLTKPETNWNVLDRDVASLEAVTAGSVLAPFCSFRSPALSLLAGDRDDSSRNSSKPRSSDGPKAPPRAPKTATGRKPSGQEGHEKPWHVDATASTNIFPRSNFPQTGSAPLNSRAEHHR